MHLHAVGIKNLLYCELLSMPSMHIIVAVGHSVQHPAPSIFGAMIVARSKKLYPVTVVFSYHRFARCYSYNLVVNNLIVISTCTACHRRVHSASDTETCSSLRV